MSYSLLPPEINSGWIYGGAGASPMIAAATSWQNIGADIAQAAASLMNLASLIGSTWTGPSSTAALSSIADHASWLTSAAANAETTSQLASNAASLFSATQAAVIPPPVIAANRARLLSLIATNILGQNTPAIMATEAEYMGYWAQDGAALDSYAAGMTANQGVSPRSVHRHQR